MSSAMQDMLLNMILPKEEQEQIKKLLTPDNIKSIAQFVKTDYETIKATIKSIEANQLAIMAKLGVEPANVCDSDNGSRGRPASSIDGEPRRLAG